MSAGGNVLAWLTAHGLEPNEITRLSIDLDAGGPAVLSWSGMRVLSKSDLASFVAAVEADKAES